jgi:hypothetical protein|nr:MAG TPA: hypothetical protein [Caudoviricetes sp.]
MSDTTTVLGMEVPNDKTLEELLDDTSCLTASKRFLSVKDNTEEDFYEYTQGIRQAIISRFVVWDNVHNLRLKDNVDTEEIDIVLKTLKDIDAGTNNRVKAAINKEKNQEMSDVKAIVVEALRSVNHTSFQTDMNTGRIPESQLGTRNYVEGEQSLVETDNFGNDYNYFRAKVNNTQST